MDTAKVLALLPQGTSPWSKGDVLALGVPERVLNRVGWPDKPVDPRPFVEEISDLLHDWSLADNDLMGSLRRRGTPREELLRQLQALEDAFFPPPAGPPKTHWTAKAIRWVGLTAHYTIALTGAVIGGALSGLSVLSFLFEGDDGTDEDDAPQKRGRR